MAKTEFGAIALNPPPLKAPPIPNDAILRGMEKRSNIARWIATAKARGQAPFLLSLLEAIGPLAPALAAALLVAQPLAGWWDGAGGLRELADLLDEPEGVEFLRRSLAEEPME